MYVSMRSAYASLIVRLLLYTYFNKKKKSFHTNHIVHIHMISPHHYIHEIGLYKLVKSDQVCVPVAASGISMFQIKWVHSFSYFIIAYVVKDHVDK